MLDSPMIDVALGLILFFLVMSLSVTAAQEWVSSLFKLRGKNLEKGIKHLVGHDIAEEFYNHPLMRTMGSKPSYLKSKIFSKILIDIIDSDKKVLNENKNIEKFIEKISNPKLKRVFQSLDIQADNLENQISEWFDAGMERASGWYQRRVQLCSILISSVLVIGMNANTITIAKTLWEDDVLRSEAVKAVEKISEKDPSNINDKKKEEVKKAKSLFPLGWSDFVWSWSWFFESIIGWLITIAAMSLGAPFWFDLIGKISNIRNSKKGEDKKDKKVPES